MHRRICSNVGKYLQSCHMYFRGFTKFSIKVDLKSLKFRKDRNNIEVFLALPNGLYQLH